MASYLVIEGEQVNQNTIHNQCFIVEANSSQEAKQFLFEKSASMIGYFWRMSIIGQ